MADSIPSNENQKKADIAIFISDKVDWKAKRVIRDKEGHFMMINRPIHEEDKT